MPAGALRHSNRDALLIALAAGHGALLLTVPSAPVIALALWWNANTVAHNFIHLPFFRARWGNALFSIYLSLVLAFPQTLWRDRHLAHHAGKKWHWRWSGQLRFELVIVVLFWCWLGTLGAATFTMWTTGWLAGLLLCQLQGHFEHVRGTISHYGALYNLAFFNDGYHVEHHARPGLHWSSLPGASAPAAPGSRWPAVLRWLEMPWLDALERCVLRSPLLQRYVLRRHRGAFRALLAKLPPVHRVTIVGGGLFPRTALVLRELVPQAEITIVDHSAESLRHARRYLGHGVHMVEAAYDHGRSANADLVVVPLALVGDRSVFYSRPPAKAVAVHDWIWRARGEGFVVSALLLKRLNLVRR